MKRFRIILCSIVAAIVCLAWSASAEAPVFGETANNDTRDQAQVLCMNAVLSGSMNNVDGNDTDCYRLIVPMPGEIVISLSHPFMETSNSVCDLALFWPDSESKLWSTQSKGNQSENVYQTFYLGEGEYDLILWNKSRDGYDYKLNVSYMAEPNAESEGNNVPETADVIEPNATYYGSMIYDGDVDYFKMTLDEPGAVRFSLAHDYFDDNGTFYRTSITRGIGGPTVNVLDVNGKNSDYTSNEFYLDAGEYFFRVEKYYYTNRPYSFRVDYTADDCVERERNNSFAESTDIQINQEVKGSFTLKDDKDVYHFTLSEPGKIVLSHRHEFFDDNGQFYIISLYSDARADAWMFTDKLTGKNSDWTRDAFYLPAGDYYLQYETYYWTTRPYAFTLSFTPDGMIENEWNNTYETATAINVNADYSASLMRKDDIDYYTFTLDELSEVVIHFNFEYLDDGNTFFKLFLDTEKRNDTAYYSRDLKGRENDLSSYAFYLPAGTYYFHVHSYYHTARPYTLNVSAASCADAETEWNNSYATASPIVLKQQMKGSIRYQDDIDYYVLSVSEACNVRVTLNHEWFDDGNVYYEVYLDAQANNTNRLVAMKAKGRDAEITSEEIQLQPGTYYLSVKGYYYNGVPYVVTIG